ncbi:motility associated factor glycosyltransferase family protein [Paenibacillus wynnii]|uniref:motility associated factor glycosyltransferase family protein n=1 Tax=Paenibacillus wynnii TaxID=268407 RepID=UPI0027924360|nr:6-hydroxymethylpterin diphosphokinase MptE-like protein [Paenibacillus wynnii]MDQ0194839.1 hypothetical protein [Paenibacillus wynnii]
MNPQFENNIRFLSPNLRTTLLNITEDELWGKIKLEHSTDGNPIFHWAEHDKSYQLTSMNPVKEAEEWCGQLQLEQAGCLMVYGCGSGYALLELFKRKQTNTIVMVFEQNIYIFAAMLHYFDFEPLFATQKFTFFIGNTEDFSAEFDRLLWTDVFLYCTAPSVAFTPIAQRQMKQEYLNIHKYIFETMSLNIFYIGNDHNDSLLGFHNLIANALEVVRNPYLSSVTNKYINVPAFIISNGPSLDNNIADLKKIQGKGLILSTESATLPLMKQEIIPDAICIIERTPLSYEYHFENRSYSDQIALLSLAVIDKRIFPAFPGPGVPIFRNTETINNWFNYWLGDGIGINAGASTSHLAFQVAVELGANPIILVGQDFAFGPGGVTHSKDAIYLDEKGKASGDRIKAMKVVQVESNEGTMIPSNRLWADFKQGMEQKIAAVPTITVINATEGGAKIQGTTYMPLSEAIQQYCTQPLERRINEWLLQANEGIDIQERLQRLTLFIAEIETYTHIFRRLCQETLKRIVICKEMIELSQRETETDQIEIMEQQYDKNFNLIHEIIKDNIVLCFVQQVLVGGFHQMNQLGLIDSKVKTEKVFQIHLDLFHNISLICQSMVVNFEMAAERLTSEWNKGLKE